MRSSAGSLSRVMSLSLSLRSLAHLSTVRPSPASPGLGAVPDAHCSPGTEPRILALPSCGAHARGRMALSVQLLALVSPSCGDTWTCHAHVGEEQVMALVLRPRGWGGTTSSGAGWTSARGGLSGPAKAGPARSHGATSTRPYYRRLKPSQWHDLYAYAYDSVHRYTILCVCGTGVQPMP